MEIRVYDRRDVPAAEKAMERINELDRLLSRDDPDSDIAKLNSDGACEIPSSLASLLIRAGELSKATDGAFDITVGAVTDLWGISTEHPRVPEPDELKAALETVGAEKLTVNGNTAALGGGTKIDLGAIGKGFAADEAARILRDSGVKSALLSLGGNVYAVGEKSDGKPFSVGIRDPWGESAYVGYVQVRDASVVTAGAYERCFEADGKKYGHIFDPRTGTPAESGLASVSVVLPVSADADALSTALFVSGLDKSLELYRSDPSLFEAIFITDDRRVIATAGLSDLYTFTGEDDGFIFEGFAD